MSQSTHSADTSPILPEGRAEDRDSQYRSIFEATSDGVVIMDLDGYVVEANPAGCRIWGYTHEEMIGRRTVMDVAEVVQAIDDGGIYQGHTHSVRKDGTPIEIERRVSRLTYRGKPHIVSVVRDVTERLRAEQQLREREEQYRSIFEATNDAIAIVDMDGRIVEANPATCRLHGYLRDELVGRNVADLTHPEHRPTVEPGIEDIAGGGHAPNLIRGLRKDGSSFYAETHGTLITYRGAPHILAVARDVTEQVKSYELMEQRVRERTRELSALLEISRNVTSTLDLQPLLTLILEGLRTVVEYTGAGISMQNGDELLILEYQGPGPVTLARGSRVPTARAGELWKLMRGPEPMIIGDVRADTPYAAIYRATVGDALDAAFSYVRSWMSVPMRVKDHDIGSLFLEHSEPDFYGSHHAELALAIAQQAGIAIENARLYRQAQEIAVLEERQRLARELHDSVSQALYSIALSTKTARALLERDPQRAAEPLDFAVAQAETGLTEMRALIFELRPEALETEGLAAALQKQADVLRARHRMVVETELDDEPAAPLPVKEALYRIAHEALNNVVKHAGATCVRLALRCEEGDLVLEIADNGKGFDTGESFPGHLGLQSMEERAMRAGGTLQLESAVGEGARVRTRIPLCT